MRKKNKLIFRILIIIILTSGIVVYDYFSSKRSFYRKIHNVALERIEEGLLGSLMMDYYLSYGQYPQSLKEIDSIYYHQAGENEYLAYSRKRALIDPFGKGECYYYYKPVYDRKTKLREGYIAISRGIDGRIDNFFKDTLYVEDSVRIRKTKDYFNDQDYDIFRINLKDFDFQYLNKYFGKKDYVIHPFNETGKQMMELQILGYGCLTVRQLINNINNNYCWKVACLKCAKDNIHYDNKKIVYTEDRIKVFIHFKSEMPTHISQDTVFIIGIVRNNDCKEKIIMDYAFRYFPARLK